MSGKSGIKVCCGGAGRKVKTDEIKLVFLGGANSIVVVGTLLTARNPGEDQQAALFCRLGIEAMELDARQQE
jgi:biotin synthase